MSNELNKYPEHEDVFKRWGEQLKAGHNKLLAARQRDEEIIRGLVDALHCTQNTLDNNRIGTINYMEGSEIYDDFREASEIAEKAINAAELRLKDGV